MADKFYDGWNAAFDDASAVIMNIARKTNTITAEVIQPDDGLEGCNVEFKIIGAGLLATIHVHFAGRAVGGDKTQFPGKVRVIRIKGSSPIEDRNIYNLDVKRNPGGERNLRTMAADIRADYPVFSDALLNLSAAWNDYRGV